MDLNGAVALVTGGAGGLGEPTVRRLAAAGAHVAIVDLSEERGRALADEIGTRARFVRCDVTSEDDVHAAVAAASEMGPLRVCVNAHGAPTGGGRTVRSNGEPHALADFERTIAVYLTGTFNVMRVAAAAMGRNEPINEDGERGVIVNTASIAGYEGQIGQVAYSAAKGGVIGMTIVAARDLGVIGVRVVTIAPGTMFTPAYRMPFEQANERWAPLVPFPRRMGHADEYGALVQHICENAYLNGEVIRLDGAVRFPPK